MRAGVCRRVHIRARARGAQITFFYDSRKKVDKMDKGTADEAIKRGLAVIKGHMPETYAAIQQHAAQSAGTFALVRRGLSGEANCFYACEAGHVVGTPFDQADVTDDVARLMVGFGCGLLVMWALPAPAAAGV